MWNDASFRENGDRVGVFQPEFVGLLMKCVRSMKYMVRINGQETDGFLPYMGLRWGDHSPTYLFHICA